VPNFENIFLYMKISDPCYNLLCCSQKSIIGGDMYHGSQIINSESYQGQSFGNSGNIYNQGQKDMNSVESLIPNI